LDASRPPVASWKRVRCTSSSAPRQPLPGCRQWRFAPWRQGRSLAWKSPSRSASISNRGLQNLLQTVRLMAEVKVVAPLEPACAARPRVTSTGKKRARRFRGPQPPTSGLIGIGASTGGPLVLQTLLSALPKDFPVPLLIVQHIARGLPAGHGGLVESNHRLRVRIARAWRRRTCRPRVCRAPMIFTSLRRRGHMVLGTRGG